MHILSAVLVLYCWIVTAVLVFFLFLIGRFYEIKFGRRSYYQLFLLPLGLFLAAAVWGALTNDNSGHPLLGFVGSLWPDLLLLIGGLVLVGMCYSLFKIMMGGRR